jgi:two-component system nitrate/nitrite sensor histidine kinase NarX
MNTIHVLLIDDSEAQSYLVDGYLRQARTFQFTLSWAGSFSDAVRMVRASDYDVCLLDYDLGTHTALDVLNFFADEGVTIPVIVMTGYGSQDIDLAVMESGAVDYLDKNALGTATLERAIRYTVQQARVAKALVQAEHQQRVIAESLLDVSNVLNSSLDFSEVLKRIIDNLRRVIPHQGANVMMIGDDGWTYLAGQIHQDEAGTLTQADLRFEVLNTPTLRRMLETRQPLLIGDVRASPLWTRLSKAQAVRAYLGTPIVEDDAVIGFINIDHDTPDYFTPAHAEYLRLFGNQAAIAIRNARAYEQAQELAALEERQRLARELHDVVSQTLFSANMVADSLSHMAERDAPHMQHDLEMLARLNRTALAEMRSLLVELRPQAIVSMPLPELLQTLVNGVRGRSSATLRAEVVGQPVALSPDVHLQFYRLMQETLTNAYKHAQATEIQVGLHYLDSSVDWVVADNGVGFDLQNTPPDHHGLRIMFERAAKIGAAIRIDTAPNEGTFVQVSWPLPVVARPRR